MGIIKILIIYRVWILNMHIDREELRITLRNFDISDKFVTIIQIYNKQTYCRISYLRRIFINI